MGRLQDLAPVSFHVQLSGGCRACCLPVCTSYAASATSRRQFFAAFFSCPCALRRGFWGAVCCTVHGNTPSSRPWFLRAKLCAKRIAQHCIASYRVIADVLCDAGPSPPSASGGVLRRGQK